MKINTHSSGIKIEVSKTGRWLEKLLQGIAKQYYYYYYSSHSENV